MDRKQDKSSYMTPSRKARCRFTVQGSRFIGTLAPASTEEAVHKILARLKEEFPDATHHTYAFRTGAGAALVERSSDDREPAGSAGSPMLQVLQGHNVSDVVVVGTRYFGGTKLGLGGLIRAYRDCARLSLETATLKIKEQVELICFHLDYEALGPVTRLIENLEGKIVTAEYTESVALKVKIPARLSRQLTEEFTALCRGRGYWSRPQA